MSEETLIDVLPASDFTDRQVKVQWKDDRTQHPSAAICRGPGNKGKVLVQLMGTGQGKKLVEVDAKRVLPWWAKNPDLKEKRDQIILEKKTPDSMSQALEKANLLKQQAPSPAHQRKAVVTSVPAPVVRQPGSSVPVAAPIPYPQEKPPVLDLLPAESTADFDETPPPPPPLPDPPAQKTAGVPKPPVQHDYRNFHGVTATVNSDPTWAADFAELQQTFASIKEDEEKISALVGLIDEKRDMLGLIAQELEKKGVTLLWNTPVKVHGVHPTTGDPELMLKVEAWISKTPLSFTYPAAANEIGVPDSALFRSYLKKVATSVGYFVGKAPGYQSPMIFNRPV